jgi:hypothetical protein
MAQETTVQVTQTFRDNFIKAVEIKQEDIIAEVNLQQGDIWDRAVYLGKVLTFGTTAQKANRVEEIMDTTEATVSTNNKNLTRARKLFVVKEQGS